MRNEDPRTTRGHARDLIAETVSLLLRAVDEGQGVTQRSAIMMIGQSGCATPEVAQALQKALGVDEPAVRKAAADALRLLGIPEGDTASLLVALRDGDADVRSAAARAYRAADHVAAPAIAALVACLTDPDAEVRATAAEALGPHAPATATTVMALILACDDPDRENWRVAERALTTLASRHVAPTVDEDDVVDQLLATNDQIVTALLRYLDELRQRGEPLDHSARSTDILSSALGMTAAHNPGIVETLVAYLRLARGTEDQAYLIAGRALGRMVAMTSDVAATLFAHLTDEHPHVRAEVAGLFGNRGEGTPMIMAALMDRLTDEDRDVRMQALYSLQMRKYTGDDFVAALALLLGDSERVIRESALTLRFNPGSTTKMHE